MNSGNLPAAPCTAWAPQGHPEVTELGGRTASFPGLTKREYFAGQAMQGICGNPNAHTMAPDAIARRAMSVAKTVLAALEQQVQIAQARLKHQPVKGTVSVKVGPVELTSINLPTNAERLASYVAKRESARNSA